MSTVGRNRVGGLRPSQLLWTFGPGSVVDLPHLSVVVMGLDHWDVAHTALVKESRLLQSVKGVLGPQVQELRAAPLPPNAGGRIAPMSPEALIGVPVRTFPRWLRCSLCNLLAPADSGLFELKANPFRPDLTRYVHSQCQRATKPPTAVPARFLVACRGGHLSDFPWRWYVHRGNLACMGSLEFYEVGASLQTENLWVRCREEGCGANRSMAEAFGERASKELPRCPGAHAHLGTDVGGCNETLRAVLLGASNAWFPITRSALAIPDKRGALSKLIEDNWTTLQTVTSRELVAPVVTALRSAGVLPGAEKYSDEELWTAIESKRAGSGTGEETEPDLKIPEWEALTDPDPANDWPDFLITKTEVPPPFVNHFAEIRLVERLREVNALIGFTRVDPPEVVESDDKVDRAPLSIGPPNWVPATEVRGEGIFIRFSMQPLEKWLMQTAVKFREEELFAGHVAWRTARDLEPPAEAFPGILEVFLHTFAHVLIRELALECGYNMASIRERVYSSGYGEGPERAGVLVYTAAADSDGTLGGLVELGKPENLGRLVRQALWRAGLCSSDPLCAEHTPMSDRSLHAAACHACTFVPETSCEFGNRYLDRSLLVPTLATPDLSFFEAVTSL